MCSTHFITTTTGIKSNLSKWPQLLAIIFWRHLKTKGKIKTKLVQEQQFAKGPVSSYHRPWAQRFPSQAWPSHRAFRADGRGGGPHETGSVQRSSEKKDPFEGCVQDNAEGCLALCLSDAALLWHITQPTHFCADTPLSQMLQQAPKPTKKAKGRGTWRSIGYSFWLRARETYSQTTDPAGRAQYSVQALVLGHNPSQPAGPVFPSEVSGLCSSFPC